MKIAFLVAAHNDVEHLRRLTAILSNHDVYIHWDAKSGVQPLIEDVKFTNNRISVFWAGFSQVDATMELIKTALSSNKKYDKYVLLSGSCFPIKPISELELLFKNDLGKNYLNAIKVDDTDFLKHQVKKSMWMDGILPLGIKRTSSTLKIEKIIRFALNKLLKIFPKRNINMDIYHGSNWWALNHESVAYALKIYETRSDIIEFFKHTFASDEKFFHTIIRNSEFQKYCGDYSEFTGRGTYKMANLHIIDPSLSKWFSIIDFDKIQTSDKFFVRKVRSLDGFELVNKIENQLL